MPSKSVTKVEFPEKELGKGGSQAKKRIAAYARVSTVLEAQQNSLQSQEAFFRQYINQHKDWTLVGVYTDDGVSGLSLKGREGFANMIDDALTGNIDIIITKSLSRFARNTVDLLVTIRKLKEKGVAVIFQRENINTLDAIGEFLITLLASFAEEESRSISENVKWGIRRRFEKGIYTLPANLYGYRMEADGLALDPEKSKVVRFIYLLALSGKCNFDIATILTEYGFLSPHGTDSWEEATVKELLNNEKFKGDARLQKTVTTDFITKKHKVNEGEAPQYYVKNGHLPLILTETWDETQDARFLPSQRNNTHNNPLANKIICGDCRGLYGPYLWHSTTTHDTVWECHNRKRRKFKCRCHHIYDFELQEAVRWAFRRLYQKYPDVIDDCRRLCSSVIGGGNDEVLNEFERLRNEDMPVIMDGLSIGIVLDSITVTSKNNLVFRFADGTTFIKRYGIICPKGKPGAFAREWQNRQVMALRKTGMTAKAIAEELHLSHGAVRGIIQRQKKKQSK